MTPLNIVLGLPCLPKNREAHIGTQRRRKELFPSEKERLLEALRVCRKGVIDSHSIVSHEAVNQIATDLQKRWSS